MQTTTCEKICFTKCQDKTPVSFGSKSCWSPDLYSLTNIINEWGDTCDCKDFWCVKEVPIGIDFEEKIKYVYIVFNWRPWFFISRLISNVDDALKITYLCMDEIP